MPDAALPAAPAGERPLVYAALTAGGLGGLAVGSRPWWRAVGAGVDVGVTGSDGSAGLTQALSVVVLVGALLALTLRARGRRVLGVLLVLPGLAMAAYGLVAPAPSRATIATRVQEVSLAGSYRVASTGWPLAYAAGGLLVMAAGLALVLRAARWPSRPDRFDRLAVVAAADADAATLWRAQDAGLDLTRTEAAGRPDPRDPRGDDSILNDHNGSPTARPAEPSTRSDSEPGE